jgi:hypothetical protein
MSSVMFQFPKLRLASQLREAGGLTVADALAAADSSLGELQPEALVTLQSTADQAMAAFRRSAAAFDPEAAQTLYAIAARGVGSGAVAGAPAADEALISLCDLLDHLANSQRWDLEAIGVHVSALQMLAYGSADHASPGGLDNLLAGLRRVTARHAGNQKQPAA